MAGADTHRRRLPLFGDKKWHRFNLGESRNFQQGDFDMQRRAVNPWDWSLKFGYNQAEIIAGATRQLICAGQTAVE